MTGGGRADRAEVARFFSGLDLLPPGLVQLHRWQPGTEAAAEGEIAAYCGLARKPWAGKKTG